MLPLDNRVGDATVFVVRIQNQKDSSIKTRIPLNPKEEETKIRVYVKDPSKESIKFYQK